MVTADYATIDPITGKLHILGVFRNISASVFPCQHSRMCLALTIEGDITDSAKSHELSVKLADEDGKEVFAIQGGFELPKDSSGMPPYCNVLIELNDLRFEEPGEYCFYVSVDSDKLEENTAIQVVLRENGSG